jgi:D-alanyl-D-alanine carboxypeptidase
MTTTNRSRLTAVILTGLAVLASACAPPAAGGPAATATAAPEPAYAAALRPRLDQLMKDLLATGAVVLVRSPELGDWTTTLGTRTYRGTDPVQVGDSVRVGSNTKTWTGTVILQLVQEGRIALADPVSKYRPDVRGGANISIEQLLDMHSGLANYTTTYELNHTLDVDPAKAWNPEDLLKMGLALDPSTPGAKFEYSNTNTVLLGLIIEKVTGHPVAEEFRTRLFTPLGMSGTVFPDITSDALPDPHARGYAYGTNVETATTEVLSPAVQAGAKDGSIVPKDVTGDNPSWAWTAGAGISTAGDLATWVEALGGGKLLGPALQRQRLESVRQIVPGNPESPFYGLAIAKFGPLYGHSGELPGYNSFMGYDPDRKITVVTWATTAPSPDGRGPAVELAKAVIAAVYGKG